MAQQDRYGLSATFEFDDGDSLAKIQKSINQLNQLQQQIDQFRQQQSRTVSVVGSVAQQVGRANQQAANTINRFNRPNQQLKNQLQSIAKEFRAIKAEARNIDFGDLHDTRAFESGRQSIARYVSELKALESQIAGVSAEERILTANLKRQQKVMEDRVSVAANQRTAAIAQQRMGVAGGVATAGAAALLPLVSVGKEAINTVASFDDQIAQARAVSGASIEESNRIRERAKQLGAETKFSASQAASAFVLLGQAGYNADQQLKAIDGTLMLAAAGGIDLATATDIAVSTMGGFNAKAEEAIHYSNVLAQTANAANLGVADLGETMKYVAPAAKAYGASVEQAAAMAGVLSNAGIKGTQAGTSLRAMFLRLSAPTKAASGQLRQYGIDVSDSSGHLRQLPELLGEMNTALKDVDDAKKMEFVKKVFGTEASSAVLNLMANLKDVRDLTKQNIVSSVAFEGLGVAAYQAGVMEDNLAGAFRSFLSALEGVTIEIGDFLKVAVRPMVDAMTSLMRGFLNLPKPVKNLAIGVGVLLTGLSALAAVGGAIAVAFFWLQSAVATAAIGLTTMASAGLPLTGFFATVMNAFAGQGLVAGFTALGSAMGGVATAMLSIAGPMAAWLLLFGFVQAFFVRLNLLGTAFSYVGSVVGLVTGLIQGFIAGASKAFLPIIGDIKALANSLFPAVKGTTYLGTALRMATDAFRDLFAVGSKVGGVLGSIIGTLLSLPLRIVIGIMRVAAKIINLAGYLYLVQQAVERIFNGFKDLFLTLINVKKAGHGIIGVFAKLAFTVSAINSIASGFRMLGSLLGVSAESVDLMMKYTERFIVRVLGFLNYAQNKTTWFPATIAKIIVGVIALKAAFSGLKQVIAVIQKIGGAIDAVLKQNESIVSFARSASHIISAWQEFVDWFANMPLVKIALDIATGLINALNHNPTVKIPLAWEDAKERISATLDQLLGHARQIGNQIKDALIHSIPSLDDAKAFLFSIDLRVSTDWIKEIPSAVSSHLPKIRDSISGAVESGVQQVPLLIKSYLPKIGDTIASFLSSVIAKIPSSFAEAKQSIVALSHPLLAIGEQVKSFLDNTILANAQVASAFYGTLSFVEKIATGFKNRVIIPVWQFLSSIVQQVADFESRTGFFKDVFGRIQSAFLYLRSVILSGWQGITGFFEKTGSSIIESIKATIGSIRSLSHLLKGALIILSQLFVVLAGVIGFARGISSGFFDGLLHPILKLLERIGGASDALQSKSTVLTRLFAHIKDAFFSLEAVGRAIGRILAVPATFGLNVVLTMLSALDYFIGAVLPFFRLIASVFSGIGSVFQIIDSIPFPLIALGALAIVVVINKVINRVKELGKQATVSAQKNKSTMDIFIVAFSELFKYIGRMRTQFVKLSKGVAIQSKGIGNFAQGVSRISKSLSDMGAEITGLVIKIGTLSLKILPRAIAAFNALRKMDMSSFSGEIKEIAVLIGKNTKNISFRIKRIIKAIHQVGVAVRQTIRGIRDIVTGSAKAGKAISKIFDNSQGQLNHLIAQFGRLMSRVGQIIRVHTKLFVRSVKRSAKQSYQEIKQNLQSTEQQFAWLFGKARQGYTAIGVFAGSAANTAAAKWTIALDSIHTRMKRLTRRARAIGRLLVKNLSENSPGPTFQIRQKWTQTTESIQGQMSELAIHASKAGKKMAAALGKGATDRLSKLSGGFSQAGSLLSNFAPSLAAPLFVVGDLLDTIDMAKEGLPGLKKGFTAVKAATSGAAKEFSRVATAIPGVLQGVTDIKDVFPGLAQGFARLKDFKLTKPDWSQWKSSASETFAMVGAAWVDVSGNVMDLARDNGAALKKSFSGFKAKSGKMLEQAKGHLSTLKSSTTQLVKTGVAGFSGWLGSVGEMRHELAGLRASTVAFAKSGLKGFSRWINTIPELTSLMSFFGWTSAAANTAQAATSASASAATATQTAVTVSGTAAMSTGFAGLAAAAQAAWASTVAPLLPVIGQFLAVAAAIGAVLGVIKLIAPNFNVLAAIIRPLSYLMGFLYGVVEGLLSPFFDLTETLRGVYDAVRRFIFPAFTLAIRPIESLTYYLYEVSDAFLSSFGTGASLGRSLGVLISNVLLSPLRLIGAVLRGIGKSIAEVFASIGSAIVSAVTAPIDFVINAFQSAVERIRAAWQGFVDWFSAMPLVEFAGGIAQGLINALNHNPTVKIPIAWEGARSQITDTMSALLSPAQSVGDQLSDSLNWVGGDELSKSLSSANEWIDSVGESAKSTGSLIAESISPVSLITGIANNGAAAFRQVTTTVNSVSASISSALSPVVFEVDMAFDALGKTSQGATTVVGGIAGAFTSVIGAVSPVMRGVATMLDGLEAAGSGDFSQMDRGWSLISKTASEASIAVGSANKKIVSGLQATLAGLGDIGNVVRESIGGTLSFLSSSFGSLFSPIAGAVDKIKGAWSGFKGWFGDLTASLPGMGQEAGKGLINALNHNPTVKIPLAWEEARTKIEGSIADLVPQAQTVAGDMVDVFADRAKDLNSTLQDSFGGSVAPSPIITPLSVSPLSPANSVVVDSRPVVDSFEKIERAATNSSNQVYQSLNPVASIAVKVASAIGKVGKVIALIFAVALLPLSKVFFAIGLVGFTIKQVLKVIGGVFQAIKSVIVAIGKTIKLVVVGIANIAMALPLVSTLVFVIKQIPKVVGGILQAIKFVVVAIAKLTATLSPIFLVIGAFRLSAKYVVPAVVRFIIGGLLLLAKQIPAIFAVIAGSVVSATGQLFSLIKGVIANAVSGVSSGGFFGLGAIVRGFISLAQGGADIVMAALGGLKLAAKSVISAVRGIDKVFKGLLLADVNRIKEGIGLFGDAFRDGSAAITQTSRKLIDGLKKSFDGLKTIGQGFGRGAAQIKGIVSGSIGFVDDLVRTSTSRVFAHWQILTSKINASISSVDWSQLSKFDVFGFLQEKVTILGSKLGDLQSKYLPGLKSSVEKLGSSGLKGFSSWSDIASNVGAQLGKVRGSVTDLLKSALSQRTLPSFSDVFARAKNFKFAMPDLGGLKSEAQKLFSGGLSGLDLDSAIHQLPANFASVSTKIKQLMSSLSNDLVASFVVSTERISGLWQGVSQKITTSLLRLTEKAKKVGADLIRNLSENSPGPTFQIRQKWTATTEAINGKLHELVAHAKVAGAKIAGGLSKASGGFSQAGSLLSGFAPELAAPLFIVGDLLNTIDLAKEGLPGLKKGFAVAKAATLDSAKGFKKAAAAIPGVFQGLTNVSEVFPGLSVRFSEWTKSTSEMSAKIAGIRSSTVDFAKTGMKRFSGMLDLIPGLTSLIAALGWTSSAANTAQAVTSASASAATATQTAITVSGTAAMSTGFTGLAATAQAAWASIVAPLLPLIGEILALAAAIGAVIGFIQLVAPNFNVLALMVRPFAFTLGLIYGLIQGLLSPFFDLAEVVDKTGKTIVSTTQRVTEAIRGVFKPIIISLNPVFKYLSEVKDAFVSSFSSGQAIGKFIGKMIANILTGPVRLLILTLKLIGKLVLKVLKPIGAAIVSAVTDPIYFVINFVINAFQSAVERIRAAWQGFVDWFKAMPLVKFAGGIAQGLIDALNHNPTVKIPIAWEEARDRIQGSIAGLVPQAESVAGDLVGAFSDRAGQLAATLQQSLGGGIDSPTISPATPGAPVQLSVDPQPAVGALQKLKTTATQTGEQLRQSLSNVVNTQPVDQLRSAMQSVKTAAEKAGDSMKGLLLSAIATGLAALAGLSPVVLVVGGLALAAGAVATNFLGARTILKGLGQVATGSIKMAIAVFDGLAATVKMVIGVISGIAQAIGGVPAAIRGDFSQVQVGLDQVGSSFRAGFMMIGAAGDRLAGGLRTVFGGLSTIGQGFGEAIGQIKSAIGGTINFAATLPERLGAIADQLVAVWHVGVQQIGRIIPSVDWSRFDGLPAWLGGISDRLISAWRTVSTTIAGVLLRPDLSLIERAQSVMTAASDAIGSAWRSVVVLIAGLPLVGDGSGLERLKGLAQSVADGIGSIWRGLTGMIGSLPLVPDGSGFERARAIAQSAGDAIQSGWRGLVGWLSSQPLTVDGSAFERARGLVSGASESIQSVWRSAVGFVAGLPLTATWDALRELPERIGAITDSLQVTWQSTVAFINNLIPQVDLSHLLSLPDRVGSVMADIKQSVVSTAEGLAAPFVAAVDKIVGLWQGLTDKITAPLSELVEKAKGFGLGLIRNLSENSPGPTFQIRQKWMATTEAIAGQLTGLTAHAKTAGAQIATGLGDKATSKLSKLSGGFTQAGVLLSNFAPGLAAPLFVVNDVLDTIGMAQENLPALKDGFSKLTGVTAQLPQRLGAIGSGLLSIAGTGLSTLSAAITPALASIGTAATAAWSSLIAPLLPFIAIAAGVVLAIVLIRKAFKSNFLGLRDIVDRVMGAIASAGVWVAAPFQMIGKTITGAIDKLSAGWDRVKSLVGGVLGFLPRAAKETGGQLVDALNHNPTVKIPLAWEAAGGQISQTMTGLVDRATVVASDLTDRLTLAPQITPEVISPTNATTPLATPGAIAVPVEVTGTRQLDQVKATIQTVSQSAGQFARNAMAAIGSLPQWGQKAQDAIASVAGQFGWATAGAIGFGVTALAGLSPVVLVAGALALAAGAVMSNFLGARTIVKGLGQVASGSIEIAIAVFDGLAATVRMVVGAIKGIVQAIGGIPAALRGDFSQVQAGLDQVGASFKSGFAAIGAAGDRLIGGLRTVFDGLSTIGRGFLAAVDQISAAVRGLPGLAGETFTSIGARVDGLRQSLSNAADAIVAPFVGAIEKIGALWSGLTDRVTGFFGKLTGKAQSTGQQLVSALAENSPGPTFQIRQKWAATTEAIGGHLSELVAKGKKTGGQLAASLGDKVAGKLGKISGGFTQIGVLLSNVSPALAAPFFLMNDILDSAGMVAENLPALQKGLSKVGVIAGKLPGMLGGLGATLGSLGSSLLTLAGPVVTAIGSSLVPIFGAVATAAGTAWSAVIAPALPFVGIAAAIVGAVWLIKKAFDTNFLGIRDLITNVFKAIGAVGAWLLTPFRAIGNAVQGAIALITGGWQQVKGVVSGVLGFLPGLAIKAGNGLVNALNHNPTVRIPIAWDEARTQVTGSIQSMVPVAESAGTQMSAALSSQPVIQPIVATPTSSGEAALPTATQTVQQQVAAPASGASFLAPITAGVAGVTAQFDQMRSAATGAIGSAIDGVSKLSGGFVQLAVAALPSLLPIGLALAGIALAAAAIATNFLGVRTIISAVFDAIRGAIEGVRQVFSGMVQIVQGVINVFQGLGAALTGDWSPVQVGLTQIRSGFQYVFGGLGAIVQSGIGLAKGVLTGFGQAVRQVWSVVKQFLGPVGDLIEGIFDRIGATIRDVMSRIELLTSKLAGVGQAIANSPFGKLFGGGKNAAAAMPEPEAKQGGWWTKLGGDKTDEPSAAVKTADEIATDRINSAQTALSSLGSIASVIAPQLAGPIGAVSSLFDGFIGLAGVLPQISSAMSFFGFTASAANTAQSVTAGAAAGATATQTGVTVTGTAAMATGFTGLAAAAGTAWAAITGPLLPIIAGIAIIGAVIWAVSKNVWGLGDAFRAAWRVTIEPFWRAFYEAGASIRAAFISLGQAISEIFGIRAVGPLNLFGKLAAGIFTVLLLPIRILAIAVGGLIKLIGGVIAAAIYGIATLARIVFWPVSMVLRGVEAIRVAVWAVVNGIANLLLRPFDAIGVIIRFVGSAIGAVIGGVAAMGRMIWSVIQPIAGWMVSLLGGIFAGPLQILKSGISAVMSMFTGMASGVQSAFAMVTGAIGSAFSMIWTLIPAPLRWILEQASKGIGWLMSAVTGGGQPQGTLEPQRFAVGGLVKGPGGPTGDRVPALLSAGEFVVNAAATASNLPILAALNAGRALAQDGAPEVMPMPVPMPPVRSVGSMASGASLGNAGGREVTINLNFGGITLQGSPTEAAEQFKAEILYDEQFQRAVRDALRDLVEFSK